MVAVLDTGTVIETQYNAVYYTPAADAPGRSVDFYTIHWWGDTWDFDVVINTFCNGGKQTSAHYIVEEGRVACVVSPDDVAWACGNWTGNLKSISIECHPRGSAGDYREIASLLRYLRGIYGDKPLVPHRNWTATSCPGNYDLDRLAYLVDNPDASISSPVEEDVAITPEETNAIAQAAANEVLNRQFERKGSRLSGSISLGTIIQWFDANVEFVVNQVLEAIKTVPGVSLPEDIAAQVSQNLADRLKE